MSTTVADPDETFAHWVRLYLNAKGFDLGTLRERLHQPENDELNRSFRAGLDRARARTSMDHVRFTDLTAMDFDDDELEDFLGQVHTCLYGEPALV